MGGRKATAQAPASIGNVGVGFDMMGLAFGVAHDRVTAHVSTTPGIRLGEVNGLVTRLPAEIDRNTALRAGAALMEKVDAPIGVVLDVDKGVPMSAGMGGSAASAVASVLAINALLPAPLPHDDLLMPALAGEAASADPPPLDNVVASLLGGLSLIRGTGPRDIVTLPLPDQVDCLLVHPDLNVETQAARDMLRPDVSLETAIEHARNVAGFVAACYRSDLGLMADALADCLVEPQRAPLVPFLPEVQKAARDAGALGCSLSGSGPSIFAWAPRNASAQVARAMTDVLDHCAMPFRLYEAPLASPGARVIAVDGVTPCVS